MEADDETSHLMSYLRVAIREQDLGKRVRAIRAMLDHLTGNDPRRR
jgi:hypothetical protein